MSTPSTRMCTTVLRLTILLCCWLQTHHSAFAANVTVPDTDPSILYLPQEFWSASSNLCSTCLNPGVSVSYHEGMNTALSPNSTAVSASSSLAINPSSSSVISSSSSPAISPSSSSVVSPSSPPVVSPSSTNTPTTSSPLSSPSLIVTSEVGPPSSSSTHRDPHDDDGPFTKGMDGRALARQLPSYPGSEDNTPVTLSYNFTGTAIYLFCIQPPSNTSVGGTPTTMNLSFTLDNQPAGNFFPTETNTEFLLNQNVLSLVGLSDQLHQLVVTLGDDSVFLFSGLIYTNSSAGNSTSSAPHTTHAKKNNVATFAGAIGGSVGVLSLFSLGLAISIIRRRILAARRDRLDSEAQASDTPTMIGPMPFVPRFFPDTIIPPDPPTYDDALSSTNHNNTPLLASLSPSERSSRQRSYADIPPASPPPPLDELPPPPPFSLALSVRIPDIPGDVIVPSISTGDQAPGSPDVITSPSSSNSTSLHEGMPLLHSSRPDARPRSRMSTRSIVTPEIFETNLHQEDAS